MWSQTTEYERSRRILDEELEEFLPQQILDFHAHVVCDGVTPTSNVPHSGAPVVARYSFEDLSQDLAECYPRCETAAVCAGSPQTDRGNQQNNDYVARGCDNKRFFGLRLFDSHRDKSETVYRELQGGKFLGLAPRRVDLFEGDAEGIDISAVLPDWAMEIVNDLGALILLHLPRRERLADPVNQQQLVRLCTAFPRVRIVLAHIGRAYFYKDVVGKFDRLRELPNLYYNLAIVNGWEVMEYAFRKLEPHKILFGTDTPITRAPRKSIEGGNQCTYLKTDLRQLSTPDDHRGSVLNSFLHEELCAIRKAIERVGMERSFVDGLFWGHGMALLGEVMMDMRVH